MGFVIGDYTPDLSEGAGPGPSGLPLPCRRNTAVESSGSFRGCSDIKWLGSRLAEAHFAARRFADGWRSEWSDLRSQPHPERIVGNFVPGQIPQPGQREGTAGTRSPDRTARSRSWLYPLSMPPKDNLHVTGLASKAAYGAINEAAKRGFVLIAAAFGLALALSWLIGRSFVTKPFDIIERSAPGAGATTGPHRIAEAQRRVQRSRGRLQRSHGRRGERSRLLWRKRGAVRLALDAGGMGNLVVGIPSRALAAGRRGPPAGLEARTDDRTIGFWLKSS